jgi:hypothetical protein
MPVKFVGSTIGTTLTDGVTYYVKSLVKLPNPLKTGYTGGISSGKLELFSRNEYKAPSPAITKK